MDDEMNICRLCLGIDNLIWIFDDRIETPQSETMIDVVKVTTGVTISPSDNVSQMLCHKCVHITIGMFKFRSSSLMNDMELKNKAAGKLRELHHSVEVLQRSNPNLCLPSCIKKTNILPSVAVDKNEVQNWMMAYESRIRGEEMLHESKRKEKEFLKEIQPQKEDPVTNVVEAEVEALSLEKDIPRASKKTKSAIPKLKIKLKNTQAIDKQVLDPQPVQDILSNNNQGNDQTENISENVVEKTVSNVDSNILSSPKSKLKRKLETECLSPNDKKSKLSSFECEDSMESLVQLKYVTKSLFVCDICSSILYNAKELKKHRMKHMRCSLCRKTFRTVEEANEHATNKCRIKEIMNNRLIINIIPCDKDNDIIQKYPTAFGITQEENNTYSESQQLISSKDNSTSSHIVEKTCELMECSEIMDNKEESISVQNLNSTKTAESFEVIKPKKKRMDITKNEPKHKTKEYNTKSANTLNSFKSQPLEVTLISDDEDSNDITKQVENSILAVDSKLEETSLKPNISIIGCDTLDVDLEENDMLLLKNILTRSKGTVKVMGVQSDMLSNNDIVSSKNKDKLFELINLRPFLNFYKVPINISYGNQYSLRYSHEPSPMHKKDRFWSKTNTKVPSEPTKIVKPVPSSSKSKTKSVCQNSDAMKKSSKSPQLEQSYIPKVAIPTKSSENVDSAMKGIILNSSEVRLGEEQYISSTLSSQATTKKLNNSLAPSEIPSNSSTPSGTSSGTSGTLSETPKNSPISSVPTKPQVNIVENHLLNKAKNTTCNASSVNTVNFSVASLISTNSQTFINENHPMKNSTPKNSLTSSVNSKNPPYLSVISNNLQRNVFHNYSTTANYTNFLLPQNSINPSIPPATSNNFQLKTLETYSFNNAVSNALSTSVNPSVSSSVSSVISTSSQIHSSNSIGNSVVPVIAVPNQNNNPLLTQKFSHSNPLYSVQKTVPNAQQNVYSFVTQNTVDQTPKILHYPHNIIGVLGAQNFVAIKTPYRHPDLDSQIKANYVPNKINPPVVTNRNITTRTISPLTKVPEKHNLNVHNVSAPMKTLPPYILPRNNAIVTSVTDQNVRVEKMQEISSNGAIPSSSESTSSHNKPFKPMIRVKNVSELR